MSSALASFAAAACTVRARSAAEIPVVTPSAASMDTVNLVQKPEPLRGAISGSFQSTQRSRVMGMQIRDSDERRVGTEFGGKVSTGWWMYTEKQKIRNTRKKGRV